MNLKKMTVELSVPDVQQIHRIDMDEDAGDALRFIEERLAKQVKEALQPH